MRTTYIVSYDIADEKRLRRVHGIVREYGDRLQYSVYRCSLTEKEKVLFVGRLERALHHREDQVLFIRLGPTGGRQTEMEALGRLFTEEASGDIIV